MEVRLIDVDSKVIEVRGVKVILDSDVAALYGVETKEVNQAVRNNPDKFPTDYVIPVGLDELNSLRSKFSTLKNGRGKHVKYPPKAFTEKGLYMLATILKSPQATETTLAIIETFTKLRELTRTVREVAKATTDEERKPLVQKGGEIISDIIGDALAVSETETTLKINLAVLSFEHTVRRIPKSAKKTTKKATTKTANKTITRKK